MVVKDTLKIKNLPKELSDAQKEDFVRHFGASKIRVITSRARGRSVVYAKFESPEVAKSVLFRLHQITILNSTLCVEYAEKDLLPGKVTVKKADDVQVNNNTFFKSFVSKINAFNDSVGFHQPPPPHLKYSYPKANRATVSNIAQALATVPKFYTQVLHLMNRMNLPPPFALPPVKQQVETQQSATQQQPGPQQAVGPRQVVPQQSGSQQFVPQPPGLQQFVSQFVPQHLVPQQSGPQQLESQQQKHSSSESEIESDEETTKTTDIIPQKRTLPQKKQVKRPKFIKPPVVQPQSTKPTEPPTDVFEKNELLQSRKIELKVSSDALETKKEVEKEPEKTGSFGIMLPLVKPDVQPEAPTEAEPPQNLKCIDRKELLENRVPEKDRHIFPVFKNYAAGAPTCRLYIKNIAKTVTKEDMEFVFNLYKQEDTEDRPSQFDIRLMQEGKMKGQAFVTLDSVEIAKQALEETNGYLFKNKPIVVMFAKSAVPKTDTKK